MTKRLRIQGTSHTPVIRAYYITSQLHSHKNTHTTGYNTYTCNQGLLYYKAATLSQEYTHYRVHHIHLKSGLTILQGSYTLTRIHTTGYVTYLHDGALVLRVYRYGYLHDGTLVLRVYGYGSRYV